ncbi:MAG: pyruvate, phosphate dikinase [Chlorobi bacterium]|nr:pyruvate, phosphate dikinase [Chlorobiota bacterium]MCI0716347.1 pyruvate, phosphate dikinase [Chlorobiota bacterium]
MSKKLVYYFGGRRADGKASMKPLLGGKGANLAEMVNLKLPVPPGFTITTEVCTHYYKNDKKYPKELKPQIKKSLSRIEKEIGAKFGDKKNPLLVSVRSGARASMPGMMDTILNLGLNDDTVQGLIEKTGNPRFVYDSYRRFIQMYGDVVMGLKPASKDERDPFEVIIEDKKKLKQIEHDTEFTSDDLKELAYQFKAEIKSRLGNDFPNDPVEQLNGAIDAVFNSWMNERAIVYRKLNNIPESWGTAVNVQSMVFGNMGETSGTGVAFTRDPASGENVFYGEYLMNAQGEDVVAGIRTPLPISKLNEQNPEIYKQLEKVRKSLEKHYKDVMDIEFTIQEGKLYILQCRVGKRTGPAAVRIAVEMVKEKLISEKEALTRVEPDQLNQLLRPVFDLNEKELAVSQGKLLAKGLNAGPGAAAGRIYFNASDVVDSSKKGEQSILVRIETSPEDIRGMNAAEGILTSRGGMTSHAALVARQMGRVCVAGCSALEIDYSKREMSVETQNGTKTLREGDWISIDGTTGEVIEGRIHIRESEILQVLIEKSLSPESSPLYGIYSQLMKWADKHRKLRIRTNADQPDQCRNAIAFGAEGIGLCRTEHMFFGGERIDAVREMILADTLEERERALEKLFPYQKDDFTGIFKEMNGMPVTIRTLDPPLHEFLPHTEKEQRELAEKSGKLFEDVRVKVESLHEFNPMMGHRGCRLGIVYPEITRMQAKAIFAAAVEVKKQGIDVHPEVMIPLIGSYKELENQAKVVRDAARQVSEETGVSFPYSIGTMIEIPRAAITADEIARTSDFFSFGTNDLTQMTFGLSRDDSGKFLPYYVNHEILSNDPFVTIDSGVSELVKIAVEKGRKVKPNLKIGICGEHGGDPQTISFCNSAGLNYVSCSPFRLPIARLAAAQAAILSPSQKPDKRKRKTKTKTKAKKRRK